MERLIENELMQDEQILWNGQPNGRLFRTADFLLIPLELIGAGFFYYFIMRMSIYDTPTIFTIIVLLIALRVSYDLIGRFFYKAYRNRNTYYYLTDQRVLILRDTIKRKLTALDLISLPEMDRRINHDGVGAIYFGELPFFAALYANSGTQSGRGYYNSQNIPPAFFDLDDADEVYSMIKGARLKALSDASASASQA